MASLKGWLYCYLKHVVTKSACLMVWQAACLQNQPYDLVKMCRKKYTNLILPFFTLQISNNHHLVGQRMISNIKQVIEVRDYILCFN